MNEICPGHGRGTCKTDVSKLSEWECGHRRPCVGHIEILCAIYQQSAEDLGLVNWPRQSSPEEQDEAEPAITQQQVVEWVRVSVAALAVEALQVLQRHLTASEPGTDQPPDERD